MSRPYFTKLSLALAMRKISITKVSIMIVFIASLCVSSIASAQGQAPGGQGPAAGGSGLLTLQAELDQEKLDRAAGDAALQTEIDIIELTPGPQGDKGDKGDTGATGAKGDKGDTGLTGDKGDKGDPGTNGAQGPQGDPGTSSWFDGYETVVTYGSVQIGNDSAECTTTNYGTIRFNTTTMTFEGCDGIDWVTFDTSPIPPPTPSFICGFNEIQDANGNMYNTVLIGTQCWMADNLNVGTMIDGVSEQMNDGAIEKYCYNDDEQNCITDGGLYQWDEMMQYTTTEGVQGICLPGWHLPTDTEWKTLEMALGMSQADADNTGWRGTNQGRLLISSGFGFEALLAGNRNPDSYFYNRGTDTWFWSSTGSGSNALIRTLHSGGGEYRVARYSSYKAYGFSVRCVKD